MPALHSTQMRKCEKAVEGDNAGVALTFVDAEGKRTHRKRYKNLQLT